VDQIGFGELRAVGQGTAVGRIRGEDVRGQVVIGSAAMGKDRIGMAQPLVSMESLRTPGTTRTCNLRIRSLLQACRWPGVSRRFLLYQGLSVQCTTANSAVDWLPIGPGVDQDCRSRVGRSATHPTPATAWPGDTGLSCASVSHRA